MFFRICPFNNFYQGSPQFYKNSELFSKVSSRMFRYILHIKKTCFLFEGLSKDCVLKNLLLVEEKSRFSYNNER